MSVNFLDIAPISGSVEIGGNKIAVPGVSAKGIAILLSRFPQLGELMDGKSVTVDQLAAVGADAVSAIGAAGLGYPGDEKAEAQFASLPIDAQADALAEILKVTLPRGIGPFVQKLRGMGDLLRSEDEKPKASQKPSKN